MENEEYPINDGIGHITNASMIKEIKAVNINDIRIINELIKKDWIFICISNQDVLLGRIWIG